MKTFDSFWRLLITGLKGIAALGVLATPSIGHAKAATFIVIADSNDNGTTIQSPEQQEQQQEDQQNGPH